MRVKMMVKYFDLDKREIHSYATMIEKVYFQFILQVCEQKIERYMEESYQLEDDEYGFILSQSELLKIETGKIYNHRWVSQSWGYDCTNQQIFIYNKAIEI